ncbi:membrane protein insertase YidC [bacterium]|nr:membrane protein insertase YidC [Candidatus Omnitrophota bacterium]MBU2528730.1 membrane protein insertase YidC [bacterium]MBU3929379.1 membrane protein insertase YidC [bacterium]MBU4122304.1 membrane protein insertase YidC [bacterium]
MNDMDKRSALAVALSFIVLALWWSAISKKQKPPEERAPQTTSTSPVEKKTSAAPETKRQEVQEIPAPREEDTLEISNSSMRCLIGKESGDIRHLFIREKNGEVDLIKEGETRPFRFYANGAALQDPVVIKRGAQIHLSYKGASAVYSLNDEYMTINLSPAGDAHVEAAWAGGIGTDPELMEEQEKRKLQLFHYNNGEKIKKISSPLESALSEWVSVSNRYFLLAFFPSGKTSFSIDPKQTNPEIVFSPEGKSLKLKILAAEKSYSGLSARKNGLEKTLNLGLFSFISVFFIHILNFFYGIFGNYGWSICLLTLIIQIFMFPLTKKNIKSAEAMKRIQPYVKKLQSQYKDDPKRMNEELLNLYRVQKVNPLGGCLPVLIQIPIFWSLFTMLQGLVELRGAHFIFWLTDLSRPDMLFGHLPAFLPFIGSWPIGPLPLLMGATMFFQQKLSITDPTQKMLLLMPLFFTFIFLKFPSGLVLYWLTSNVITLAQHILLKKLK